ncbi:hypothetical protein CO2235_MP10280 [Cupriavidus oxalaticus]|uniref:Uncharacterized protein n=1 Tax=Cupriavidus oxalaticus TaxID=96344 RepID=A0A375FGB0_9BURK|nr:hypothetical protein CO2235_U1010151 [Cupriavidus oxalaticus]SPC17981.1 hypothetical protein CO2235_MP10280 [Cupriavidus oxalaticus]
MAGRDSPGGCVSGLIPAIATDNRKRKRNRNRNRNRKRKRKRTTDIHRRRTPQLRRHP